MTDPRESRRLVAVVTGASAGLGLAIVSRFAQAGYSVVMVGREQSRLETARESLGQQVQSTVMINVCDVTNESEVAALFEDVEARCGRLDVLVNCVGESDRGLLQHLTSQRMLSLLEVNLFSTLYCTQAALPLLEQSGGVVLNIGSLASKVGARFIGGYAVAKHALAGLTQQFRLELLERGVHVCLLSPGPIKREDSGTRYSSRLTSELPEQAKRPGGGTRVKGLNPDDVASVALTMVQKRQPDRVLPSYMRILISIGHLCPSLGDWLLLKFTSGGSAK